MAAAVGWVESLPKTLQVSNGHTSWGRVNKVAQSEILKQALAAGLCLGSLCSWVWAFDPVIALPVSILITLFTACIYICFFQGVILEPIDGLDDVVSMELLQFPLILQCGHTVEANSLWKFVGERAKAEGEKPEEQRESPNKCPDGCGETFNKGQVAPSYLIGELLKHIHSGGEAASFVEENRLMVCVLPDGRSCDILQKVLESRARNFKGEWGDFLSENKADLYRPGTGEKVRVEIDQDKLKALLGNKSGYDAQEHKQLEDVYEKCIFSDRWQRLVDIYCTKRA